MQFGENVRTQMAGSTGRRDTQGQDAEATARAQADTMGRDVLDAMER